MAAAEQPNNEEHLKSRYFKISKIFFLIAIIYSLWIAVLIMGVYFLRLGSKWAALTLEQWIYTAIGLLIGLIALEFIFILHYTVTTRKRQRREKPQPVTMQGKQVHSFTLPVGAKGGIFSKTYIMIDEARILHLRYQMIQPNDLWGKKQ
jgi:membrane protein YdbS with pleckstrin-like domain